MTSGPEGWRHLPGPQAPDAQPPDPRPPDMDTAFWLWVAALPLMAIGYLVDVLGTAEQGLPILVLVISVVFVVVLSAVVLTFAILMRQGYRWARTVLTGGAVASVVYMVSSLFTGERPTAAALGFAVCTIGGSVLIAGGVVLLHRKDAHAFFTR